MTSVWVAREPFMKELEEHPSPRAVGERVWTASEPWLGALAALAPEPGVLLAEFPDWAALLDRHSTVRVLPAETETRVLWTNVPGVAAHPRECLLRIGALEALLGLARRAEPLELAHTECFARGDEECVFSVPGKLPHWDSLHARALREASLLSSKLQGHETLIRRLGEFSARAGPFPDAVEMHAVRRFMEEIEDLILIFDRNLWVLDANRAAVRLSGMTRNELRGLSARDLMDADSYERVVAGLPLLFERGALSGLTINARLRSRDVPLEVSARVAANGQTVLCIARDISRYLHLERELEARNMLLEAQNRQISDSGRLKSEFLANVSHELTTPLTCIKGFAKLLRGDLAGGEGGEASFSPEKAGEFLGIIETEADRMGELIRGLLELAKIESGVVMLDRASVSLNSIVDETLRVLKPRLDEHGLKVVTELDPDLEKNLLDPDRIKQVTLNLIDNAIKFSPPGSEILVRTQQTRESVRFKVQNPSAELRAADLNRVFARFVQRDGSFTREQGGVGLGLNLVRAIVELHGGRVWAEVLEPGRVEFSVELPT